MYKNYHCLLLLILFISSAFTSQAQELIEKTSSTIISKRSDLSTALLFENYEKAADLVYEGANIDTPDRSIINGPFLAWSIENNEAGLLRILHKEEDVDISRVYPDGTNLLHCAAQNSSPNILRYILGQKVCNVNQQRTWNSSAENQIGFTPLHYAIRQNDTETTHILLEAGVDITVTDENGKTAFDYATTPEMRILLYGMPPAQSDFKPLPEKIYEQDLLEFLNDLQKFFDKSSYPFLEKSFATFDLDFKNFMAELFENKSITDDIIDLHADDLQSSLQDFISKAEEKLGHELALQLKTQSIDKILLDQNLHDIINHPYILELALHENNDELLLKFLAPPYNHKVLKSLFIDTGIMHSVPVLYHVTNIQTLEFLIDHGAGQDESPQNFHTNIYKKNLTIDRLSSEIESSLTNIFIYQTIVTLGLDTSIKDAYFKKRRINAIIIEAKQKDSQKLSFYINNRENRNFDILGLSFTCIMIPLFFIPAQCIAHIAPLIRSDLEFDDTLKIDCAVLLFFLAGRYIALHSDKLIDFIIKRE
ncbi:ankyrin repeat domain-containing protein [Candidatus Chromulinivorax destructor]|uniref:ankyrin repeat domain-containing protein n=1 Tax=Candidatus Chromulinivorax destructor TaxID=2066483 RepID=UPI0013B39E3A|nr:ankyrin repeat domain-containing protein [Candidatus Chromulinivorax destructor]